MATELYGYTHDRVGPSCSGQYIFPAVVKLASEISGKRIFELGAGNRSNAGRLADLGDEVTAIEPSANLVRTANLTYPSARILQADAYQPSRNLREIPNCDKHRSD
jgi:protein-L-isoaspartate O-methyltransferase